VVVRGVKKKEHEGVCGLYAQQTLAEELGMQMLTNGIRQKEKPVRTALGPTSADLGFCAPTMTTSKKSTQSSPSR
jgi:hypothetical protein